MKTHMKGYYLVTDQNLSVAGALNDAAIAVATGVKIVQYRNKTDLTGRMYQEASALAEICKRGKALLIINDRIDIALAVNADGVHIGRHDMPLKEARRLLGSQKIIGVTAHNTGQAVEAERGGADYLGISPIFSTHTKADAGLPCGLKGLEAVRAVCSLPLAAIGGINHSNVKQVIQAGADMICAISQVVTKADIPVEIRRIQKEFNL